MTLNDILLWIAGLSSASGLIGLVRARAWDSRGRGWIAVYALVLAAVLVGWWWWPELVGYLAGGLWVWSRSRSRSRPSAGWTRARWWAPPAA